jgi:hypothetical protein
MHCKQGLVWNEEEFRCGLPLGHGGQRHRCVLEFGQNGTLIKLVVEWEERP